MDSFIEKRMPNFFILGAPKCGTTSLALWLDEHANVFISKPKEPQYFNTDFYFSGRPSSLEEYEAIFKTASVKHRAIGEASTGYLMSDKAVLNILKYNKSAKFIVCLRSPLEMAQSRHAQLLKMGIESEPDFMTAWNLQKERQFGKSVPITCHEKKVLLYGQNCKLGEQMQRLFSFIPRDKVHVIFLEDMKADAGKEYRRVLSFLGVDDDGRQHFPVENARAMPRFPIIAQVIRVAGLVKVRLGIKRNWGFGSCIYRLNNYSPGKSSISMEIQEEMKGFFKNDIKLLSELVGRDLSIWLN